jgi:arsenate reductase
MAVVSRTDQPGGGRGHEIGMDISRELPTKLTTDAVEAADVVITMGSGDACPIFPASANLD